MYAEDLAQSHENSVIVMSVSLSHYIPYLVDHVSHVLLISSTPVHATIYYKIPRAQANVWVGISEWASISPWKKPL